jgi:hypothetical protein
MEAMKAYGGEDVQIHVILTSALVGASRSGRLSTGETDQVPNWMKGCVDPRTGPEDMENNS